MSRRFTAKADRIREDLYRTLKRMQVTKHRVIEEGYRGCKVCFAREDEAGVVREYQFIGDHFPIYWDNFRACERAIDYLWRIYEDYMVRVTDVDYKFGTIFAGFQVTGGQKVLAITDGNNPCWDVLGIPNDATPDEAKKKYRELQKANHPDNGGDAEEFKRIESAYKEFINLKP